MPAIEIYLNKTTYQLIGIEDNEITLTQGEDDVKTVQFYFGTGDSIAEFVNDTSIYLTYGGRVTIERPDEETSNNVFLTPTYCFYMTMVWESYALKLQPKLLLSGTYTTFGIATLTIEEASPYETIPIP